MKNIVIWVSNWHTKSKTVTNLFSNIKILFCIHFRKGYNQRPDLSPPSNPIPTANESPSPANSLFITLVKFSLITNSNKFRATVKTWEETSHTGRNGQETERSWICTFLLGKMELNEWKHVKCSELCQACEILTFVLLWSLDLYIQSGRKPALARDISFMWADILFTKPQFSFFMHVIFPHNWRDS